MIRKDASYTAWSSDFRYEELTNCKDGILCGWRAFQRSFEPSHCHTFGHRQCSLQFLIMLRGKTSACAESHFFATAHCLQALLQLRGGILAAAQARSLEGTLHTGCTFGGGKYHHCRLRWHATWKDQSPEQRSYLVDTCVSRAPVFWMASKDWKTGMIIIINKKGHRIERNNYRDISLLTLSGKVYSYCLEKRCHEIIELALEDTQCGFRPGHSTTDMVVARIFPGGRQKHFSIGETVVKFCFTHSKLFLLKR